MAQARARFPVSVAMVVAAALVLTPSASAALSLEGWGSSVTPLATDESIVFDYDAARCLNQFPDAPVRAFRDNQNQTQMVIANTIDDRREITGNPGDVGGGFTFRMLGSNLNTIAVEPGCRTILASGFEKIPDNFNNQEWLTSPYTIDGQTVYALVHNEYHAWEYPSQGLCGTYGGGVLSSCWYNAITAAKSTDGGATYVKVAAPPNHGVATYPHRYEKDKGPSGYFQTSNVVLKDGYYYTLVRAESGGVIPGSNPPQHWYEGQKRGVCLLRTNNLDDHHSWRAWNGTGFSVNFMNPYDPANDGQPKVYCAPVSPDKPGTQFNAGVMTDSLTYNTYFGRWLLVGIEQTRDASGNIVRGAYYSLSSDLINWTERKLLAKAQFPWDPSAPCDAVSNYAVLDPNSTDRNYGTTAQTNYLYYMVSHCDNGRNRDVVRIPFRFQADPPQARSATGWYHGCQGAFDSQMPGYFLPNGERNYSGLQYSYKADNSTGTGTYAYGVFDKDREPPGPPAGPVCEFNNETNRPPLTLGDGDEIRYSGAFVFPTTGFWDKLGADGNAANVTIMRLTDAGGGKFGGALLVTKEGTVRFNTNATGSTVQLMPTAATIPKNDCWHFFDIHQKLSSDPSKAVNELWIDGYKQTTVNAANFQSGGDPYRKLRAGIVQRTNDSKVFLYTDMVGIGYTSPLSYLGCTGANDSTPYRFGDSVTQLGAEETVFDWTAGRDQCSAPDIMPDLPTRAFKDSSNRVHLLLSHGQAPAQSRSMLTPANGSLNNLPLTLDCTLIHTAHNNPNQGSFDNHEWLASPYTTDGQTVHSLVHNEYHGWEHSPAQCSTSAFTLDCWYNSITLAKSTNGGFSYSHTAEPTHRIASTPWKYAKDGGLTGYLAPSNIVLKDGYYYAMVRTGYPSAAYPDQKSGTCLIRTTNLDDPTSWRAWNGTAFTTAFINPYDPSYNPLIDPPANHVCEPVGPDDYPNGSFKVAWLSGNLTYNTYFQRWMLVDQAYRPDPDNPGQNIWGIYYTLSSDLINWSERKLLADVVNSAGPEADAWQCGQESPVAYPVVLDANSTDRNFTTVGQTAHLYFTRFNGFRSCTGKSFSDRDLIRVPIRFQADPPQARWATGFYHGCQGAFDSQMPGYFLPNGERNYSGLQNSYKADNSTGTGTYAYGIFDKDREPPGPPAGPVCEFNNETNRPPLTLGDGEEIRYSGAFVFPTAGFWDKLGADGNAANVTFMRLTDSGGGKLAGALLVTKEGTVRFNTNATGSTVQLLASPATIPKNDCWHFFDIHQKLSSDPTKAVNELWIDGVKQTTVNEANFPATGGPYRKLRAGIVQRTNDSKVFLYTDMVGIGYTSPLSYLGCTGANDSTQ